MKNKKYTQEEYNEIFEIMERADTCFARAAAIYDEDKEREKNRRKKERSLKNKIHNLKDDFNEWLEYSIAEKICSLIMIILFMIVCLLILGLIVFTLRHFGNLIISYLALFTD